MIALGYAGKVAEVAFFMPRIFAVEMVEVVPWVSDGERVFDVKVISAIILNAG